MSVTREQLAQYLARPWDRLRALKDRHTASRIADRGTDEALRLAELLRTHARAMGAVADDAARQDDLRDAVRLKRLIDRASRRR